MFKIGDCISSVKVTTVPTNPFGRCKYCNNISRPTKEQGRIFRGQELRLKDLCDENWNQDCHWCAILARCIKVLEPETSKMVETNPEQPMWCVINRHNAISICWNYTSTARIIERYSFRLYCLPSTEPLPDGLDVPTCPELAPEPGHESMWDYLQQCYIECLQNHSECGRAQEFGWVPKRLLYLGNIDGALSNMRIVHTDEHHPSTPYIALSHCWGKAQPLRSLTTNMDTFQQHIDFDQLSAVFQDCVVVAKKFLIDYVWIDSLCIIQDDRADWVTHAQQMDRIFENAMIVVAAVSSEDGSVPFLGPEAPNKRDSKISHPVESSALPSTLGPVRARRYVSADADLTTIKGPLTGRAWAWQEHVLSTRIIHFTESQTIWECVEARGSEMMGSLEPRDDALKTRMRGAEGRTNWEPAEARGNEMMVSPEPRNDAISTRMCGENIEKVWQHMVHEYAKRSLTYSADRLPALSGVAALFQPLFNSQYHAGLWRLRMVFELAWERSEVLSVMSAALSPSLSNSVPSWSWASIRNSAFYGFDNHFSEATVQYSVIDIDCEASTDNPLGEVRQGSSIQLEGQYVVASLMADARGFAVIVRDGFEPQRVTPDCQLIEANRTIDRIEIKTVRRALPSEAFDYEAQKLVDDFSQIKMSGDVVCLLLFSDGRLWESDTECAIVLILAPLGPDSRTMQRVALGRGGPDKLDDGGRSITWQWTSHETWEKGGDWFAGAKKGTFKVL